MTAILDLGTNTFHLLIARVETDGSLTTVFRERRFVKIAAEGIETIGDASFARGIETLIHFRKKLEEYNVTRFRAFGTAALRTASNGSAFLAAAKREADIDIELISGDEEARLITAGVLHALPPLRECILIMDIGGGSTEFILADAVGVQWQRSFPVGMSTLTKAFHHSDPISPAEVAALDAHLVARLQPLRRALIEFPCDHLVGSAGAFEILLLESLGIALPSARETSIPLSIPDLLRFGERIIGSTLAERLALPEIPAERADMIVVAMLLIRHAVGIVGAERVTFSGYALKEGGVLILDSRFSIGDS